MGDHYAVVVENTIVFNSTPPSFKNGALWWIHEITHVEQYNRWGVEMFAFNYLKDMGKSIEFEANQKSSESLPKIEASSGQISTTYPLSKIYKASTPFQFEETIVSQCIFDNDTLPVSYVVTSKGNIFAVDLITTNYVQVGFAKPAVYVATLWTFSTPKVQYHIGVNGDISTAVFVKNPIGETVAIKMYKVGKVNILQERCMPD